MIRTSTIKKSGVPAIENASSEIPDETAESDGADRSFAAEELNVHNNLYDSNDAVTVEQAVQTKLADFFGKRKASGDARPCGPHDLVPVYTSVFGIGRNDLKEERFLSRMRRTGLGEMQSGKAQGKEIKAFKDENQRSKAIRATPDVQSL